MASSIRNREPLGDSNAYKTTAQWGEWGDSLSFALRYDARGTALTVQSVHGRDLRRLAGEFMQLRQVAWVEIAACCMIKSWARRRNSTNVVDRGVAKMTRANIVGAAFGARRPASDDLFRPSEA